jgi:hypothetical protein
MRIVQAADGAAAKLRRTDESSIRRTTQHRPACREPNHRADDHGELNAGAGMARPAPLFPR